MSVLAIITVLVLAWAAREAWLSRQASRVDWLAGLNERMGGAGLDAGWADVQAVLNPQPDGSHERIAGLREETRQVCINYCESMWDAEERSVT